MTQYDRIRNMTVEEIRNMTVGEMARALNKRGCPPDIPSSTCNSCMSCKSCWLDYLNQEVAE